MNYIEYCTVNDLRANYIEVTETTDDTFIRDMIRAASGWIDNSAMRSFCPVIQTRTFDAVSDVSGAVLRLDRDLISITSITNGDGSTVATNKYVTEPRNDVPVDWIRLLPSSGLTWLYNSTTGDSENAISIAGIWCHSGDKLKRNTYSDLWTSTDTLGAAISSTSATTTTLTTSGSIKSGTLCRIDSEFIYFGTVSTTAASGLVRGVNGSTAATHSNGATIYTFTPHPNVNHVCKLAAHTLMKLRDNPQGETIVVDGVQFQTTKDIEQFVARQIDALGLVRRY